MADPARARKLAVRIRQVAASTLEMSVKDPRLAMVTITDCRVTPDLHEATVFYTVYGDETEREASAAALESARGVVRSAVGRATGVKFTPVITFVADAVPEVAGRIADLLAAARAADEGIAAARVGAVPAGDPDPYRRPPGSEDADPADGDAAALDIPLAEGGALGVAEGPGART